MCCLTNLHTRRRFAKSPLLSFFAEINLMMVNKNQEWRDKWRDGEIEVRFANGTKYSEKRKEL